MKIVNVIGGLGNQMFQYAFAYMLSIKNANEPVYIDTSLFNGYSCLLYTSPSPRDI